MFNFVKVKKHYKPNWIVHNATARYWHIDCQLNFNVHNSSGGCAHKITLNYDDFIRFCSSCSSENQCVRWRWMFHHQTQKKLHNVTVPRFWVADFLFFLSSEFQFSNHFSGYLNFSLKLFFSLFNFFWKIFFLFFDSHFLRQVFPSHNVFFTIMRKWVCFALYRPKLTIYARIQRWWASDDVWM